MNRELKEWLLNVDPSVAWQAERDLLGRVPKSWQATRRRVAKEGWGKRLLDKRASDGTWGGGLYSPKWTSTFYTMRLLMHLGIPPKNRLALESLELLLREGVTESGGVSLWSSSWTDTCVTAMLLQMAAYFGRAETGCGRRMRDWLLGEQMPDGGWNCSKDKGATHSSFHTTISTLEALAGLPDSLGGPRVKKARVRGEAFFLEHRLYRSSTTGRVVKPSFAQLSFPPRWYFDVLRGLDYFRSVDSKWDERLADAVDEVAKRRRSDGKWMAQNHHTGATYFPLQPSRSPSAMNTLRALRVLGWASEAKGRSRA